MYRVTILNRIAYAYYFKSYEDFQFAFCSETLEKDNIKEFIERDLIVILVKDLSMLEFLGILIDEVRGLNY